MYILRIFLDQEQSRGLNKHKRSVKVDYFKNLKLSQNASNSASFSSIAGEDLTNSWRTRVQASDLKKPKFYIHFRAFLHIYDL